jgi:hypothetical protein
MAPVALPFEDNSPHVVTLPLTGLSPGTDYHYRVVVNGAGGGATGVDRSFSTLSESPPQFPKRAFEKVSPNDKHGHDAIAYFRRSSTDSGDRIAYGFVGAAPGATGGGLFTNLLARRSPTSGWQSSISDPPFVHPPALAGQMHYASDLSTKLFQTSDALTADAHPGEQNNYVEHEGIFGLLNPAGSGGTSQEGGGNVSVVAATPDLDRVVLQTEGEAAAQTGPVSTFANLYESHAGTVTRVNLLPNGDPAPDNAWFKHGAFLPSHGLSDDGQRIYWMETNAQGSAGRIYVREDGTSTRLVNGSERTDCASGPSCGGDGIPDPAPDPEGAQPGILMAAAPAHGEAALFLSCEKLTDDSTAHAEGDCRSTNAEPGVAGMDLYRWDAVSGHLTDLTASDTEGAEVLGVVSTSRTMDRIYLVARGVLAPGATRGEPNLYLWTSGAIEFVSKLDSFISSGGTSLSQGDDVYSDYLMWKKAEASSVIYRASDDGRYLLFTSRGRVTAYDNSAVGCLDGRCQEVYLYDAGDGQLSCLSCPGSGEPSNGSSHLTGPERNGLLAQATEWDSESLELDDQGSRVFFETPNALVSGDSNGRYDVYEWRSGLLRLVSGGAGSYDSRFVDATPDGGNVFFLTRNSLIGSDRDGNVDLYDARVGGGFAEPVPPPACEGDACQSPPNPPNDPTPASLAASGAESKSERTIKGNCRKGQVRRNGRCVKRKKAKPKHKDNKRGAER